MTTKSIRESSGNSGKKKRTGFALWNKKKLKELCIDAGYASLDSGNHHTLSQEERQRGLEEIERRRIDAKKANTNGG